MSEPAVIIDTGPLVAMLVERDQFHSWAKRGATNLATPLLTSEPVITETCFLLQREGLALNSLWGLIERGSIRLAFELATELAAIASLMAKYDQLPMSLADATLVRLTELHDTAHVFTLDGHFRIYRKHGRQQIPLIIPDDVK